MEIPPNIEEILSGFDAARPVGQGGMASVVLYENRLTGEQLAVKMLHTHVLNDKSSIERFFHEVQASIRLDHKNIVNVLGYGTLMGAPAMVMEYVDGGDLKNLMQQTERLPVIVAAYIAFQLFKGLDYSHRLGIIHRDIKPSNILIDKSGKIKLTDFGISRVSDLTRLTVSGDVIGTPAYMSPEQAQGKKLDERSDIFSAGVLLYEMLTNSNPFLAESTSVTLLNIIRCNPAPIFELNPTVPYKMEVILDRLLARESQDRIQSAAECADLMLEIMQELQPEKQFSTEEFVVFLRDPEEFTRKSQVEESMKYLEKGKVLLSQEQASPEKAAVEFYRSLFMYPGNTDARQYLTSLTKSLPGGDGGPSDKLLELEHLVQTDPNNVAMLLQVIKRSRAEGDFIKAITYSKRLARLRPKDVYILGQIETLLPEDHVTALMTSVGKKTSISSDTVSSPRVPAEKAATASQSTSLPASKVKRVGPVSARPVRDKGPVGFNKMALLVLLTCAVFIGLAIFFGKQVKKTSDEVGKEISEIFSSFDHQFSNTAGSGVQIGEEVSGREKELLYRARDAYRTGNRPEAIRYYEDYLREFPHKPEAIHMRIQLARLLKLEGDLDGSLRILDEQIQQGDRVTVALTRLEKIRTLQETGHDEEARWECTYLEPNYKSLPNPDLQIEFLSVYAGLLKARGDLNDAVRLYDLIIRFYADKEKVLEARLLKADALISLGDELAAQRELWVVRDQSRPGSLMYSTAVEKLGSLAQGDPMSTNY
ncbi:MAG: protein kinase [bacterium]